MRNIFPDEKSDDPSRNINTISRTKIFINLFYDEKLEQKMIILKKILFGKTLGLMFRLNDRLIFNLNFLITHCGHLL